MRLMLGEMPVEAVIFAPLAPLTEVLSHEEQLFAGVRPHEPVVEPEIGETLPEVTRHLVGHRTFQMHHFIVRDGQNEVLAEGVHEAEGQLLVLVFAIHGVQGDVVQRIVHPAHVPLEGETQAAQVSGATDGRKCRGFLGCRDGTGKLAVYQLVQAAQEGDGFQVLAPAIAIRRPFRSTVVEIEHRSDGINPQPIDVVSVEPK